MGEPHKSSEKELHATIHDTKLIALIEKWSKTFYRSKTSFVTWCCSRTIAELEKTTPSNALTNENVR